MNTSNVRRLASLLSDGADCGETAAEYLEDAAAEIDRLQTAHKLIAQTESGECWHWQGDGHDFPDSLVCPVIIDHGALRDLLRDAGRLPWNPMESAPKDGTVILVLLEGSNIPYPARWDGPPKMASHGWFMTWDNYMLSGDDCPLCWRPCPEEDRSPI